MSEKNEIKEPVAVGSDSNEGLGARKLAQTMRWTKVHYSKAGLWSAHVGIPYDDKHMLILEVLEGSEFKTVKIVSA